MPVPDIAARHALPVSRVLQIVNAGQRSSRLCTPYRVARGKPEKEWVAMPTQVYWVGFAAACGRIYGRGPGAALVLTIREDQSDHVRRLVADLSGGRGSPEFCVSSRSGFQAYVRDADLCDALLAWGVPSPDPAEGSVPLELVPGPLMAHFIRGLLDGSDQENARPQRAPNRAQRESITLMGPQPLISGVADVLHRRCQTPPPALTGGGSPGMVRLTYRGQKTCAAIRAFLKAGTA